MRPRRYLGPVLLAAAFGAVPAPDRAQAGPAGRAPPDAEEGARPTPERCLDCHGGIEIINAAMDRRWKAHQNCVACHKGQGHGETAEAAHQGLIARPGDLRRVMETCGTCHSRFGTGAGLTTGSARDVVDRVLRSPMALATGEIAAVRYVWGEQLSAVARYGVRSIAALDDTAAPGALPAVAELPHARNSLADHLLRARCLQCHLWTTPAPGAPPYRGAGCAACHVAYAPDGRSRSADPTVPKTEVGHPTVHRIDRYVADAQCLTCHRDEGLGIGWNFAGWLSTRPGEQAVPRRDGPGALPVLPDVHAAAGMACIDCHDTWDVHGDGHVYGRGRSAVGIQCTTCHGAPGQAPTFTTTRGHRLGNVQQRDGRPVLVGKVSGGVWPIPLLGNGDDGPMPPAHAIPAHFEPPADRRGVSCVACHAGRVRQHLVRRFDLDERQAVPYDWAAGLGADSPPAVTQGRWSVRSGWSPIGLPMLGVNAAGRVDPLVASFHGLRGVTDPVGRTVERAHLPQTLDGRYGIGFRTVDPHRTQRAARSCVSCHGDATALGLGSMRVDYTRLDWPLRSAPDQVADREGTPIAAFSTPGERPLNHAELVRTLRAPACLECHAQQPRTDTLPPDHTPAAADVAHRRRVGRPVGPREATAPVEAPEPAGSPVTTRQSPPDQVKPAAPPVASRGDGQPPPRETVQEGGITEQDAAAPSGPDAHAKPPASHGPDVPELSPFIGR